MIENIDHILNKGIIFIRITENDADGFYFDKNKGYSISFHHSKTKKYKKGMLVLLENQPENEYFLFFVKNKQKADSSHKKIILSREYKKINCNIRKIISNLPKRLLNDTQKRLKENLFVFGEKTGVSIFNDIFDNDEKVKEWILNNLSNRDVIYKLEKIAVDNILALADMESQYEVKDDVTLLEDLIITKDASSFFDNEFDKSSDNYGTYFYKKNNESLAIIIANRTQIEKFMGIDLVYINEIHQSITLIQYKMLKQENNEWISRDNSLKTQIEKMNLVFKDLDKNSMTYRMSANPFFIRFIKNQEIRNTVQSYTIPLEQYLIMENNGEFSGSKGGFYISSSKLKGRSLSINTVNELIRNGFFGIYPENYNQLLKIIKDIQKNNADTPIALGYKKYLKNKN